MTTATNFPNTLRNGSTEYAVSIMEGANCERGECYILTGKRGAKYGLTPAIDSTPDNPAWVLLTLNNSEPFRFATIIDGEWVVIR